MSNSTRGGAPVAVIFAAAIIAAAASLRVGSDAGPATAGPDIRPQPVLWRAGYQAVPDTAADSIVYVPLWRRDGGHTTQLHVQNVGSAPANAAIELLDALGAPLACTAPCAFTIGPGEMRIVDVADVGSVVIGATGSAVVTGDQPLAVAVERVAQYDHGEDLIAYEGAVLGDAATEIEIPAVYADWATETGMTKAHSVVHVQNVGGASTSVSLDVRNSAGGLVTLGPMAAGPGMSVAFDIAAGIGTSLGGALTASAKASQPIAAVVHTRSADSMLTGGHAETWQRDVRSAPMTWLPVLKDVWGRCTSIRFRAGGGYAAFDLFGASPPAGPVPERSVVLPTGGIAGDTRPFCTSAPFDSLPSNFQGSLRITFSGSPVQPTDAYAFHSGWTSPGVGVAGPAVAGTEGSPAGQAATRLHAPVIHADWPAYGSSAAGPRLESAIAVTNPSAAAANVSVTYRGTSGACAGMMFVDGPRIVAAAGSTRFDQGAAGGSGLPAPCVGSAIIESSQPILATVLDEAYLDPPPPCVDPPPGLEAWWPLDERIGSPTARELVAGRDGAVGGPARNFGPGRVGNAYFLDGVALGANSDHVEVPDDPSLDAGTGDLTLDAWIKVAPEDLEAVAPRVIVQKLSFSGGQFGYGLQVADGALELILADGTLSTFRTAAKLPTDGDWHFVAAVVDRSSAPDPLTSVRLFVDGIVQAKSTASGFATLPPTGSLDNERPLRIGARTVNFPLQIFKGGIDEVELFKSALTDEQVADIADSGAGGKCKPTPGPPPTATDTPPPSDTPTVTPTFTPSPTPFPPCVPTPADMVAWWPFDETSGTTFHDRTANQVDGHVWSMNSSTAKNWAPGVVDGAYHFYMLDAANAQGAGDVFPAEGDFSADAWIRSTKGWPGGDWRTIVGGVDNAGGLWHGISFITDTDYTRLGLVLEAGSPSFSSITTFWSWPGAAYALPKDGGWHHAAVTVSRSSVDGGRFYLDGALVGEFDPTIVTGPVERPDTLWFGNKAVALDEVQVYHRALSHDEMKDIYEAGPSGKCKVTDSCPFEIALDVAEPGSGAPDDLAVIGTLRAIRASILDPDHTGDRIARAFDRHSPEVVARLLADGALRAEARRLVADLDPVYAPLVDSERAPRALTEPELARVDAFLGALESRAGPALAEELSAWRDRASGWAGLTAAEIWAQERVVLPDHALRSPVRHVAVSSAIPRWDPERLADGRADPAWSSRVHVEHLEGAEWAAIRLPRLTTIDGVRISPRRDPSDPDHGLGFPKDFVVQYAVDSSETICNPDSPRFYEASNWRPLVTKVGFSLPSSEPVTFSFAPRTARCVRVFGAELSQDDYGNRYLQLAELEALSGGAAVPSATAVVSSRLNRWPAERLVDGELDEAWSSVAHTEHLEAAEWAAIRLGSTTPVDGVRFLPRSDPANPGRSLGFPKDFVVQYALDGEYLTCDPSSPRFAELGNWRPLATRVGFAQPPDEPIEIDFEPRPIGCLRLFGAELSQDDYGNRYLQLDEFEALAGGGVVPASAAIVSSALGSWPAERLVDGEAGTVWSSRPHTEHLAGAEWAAVRLSEPSTIVGLRIHPRRDPTNPESSLGFPKDFVVQSSADGDGTTCDPSSPRFAELGNWSPISTHVGFEQPSAQPVFFGFEPRPAGCVRVFGAELSQDDYGNRYFQLGEIEVLRSGD